MWVWADPAESLEVLGDAGRGDGHETGDVGWSLDHQRQAETAAHRRRDDDHRPVGQERQDRGQDKGRFVDYTVENVDRPERGTEIVLHLRDDEQEFLDSWRLRSIISKFSDHIDPGGRIHAVEII